MKFELHFFDDISHKSGMEKLKELSTKLMNGMKFTEIGELAVISIEDFNDVSLFLKELCEWSRWGIRWKLTAYSYSSVNEL